MSARRVPVSASRRQARLRIGVLATAVALAAAGVPGAALAAPAASPGLQRVTLSQDQLGQLRDQLAARHGQRQVPGLPARGPASLFLELDTPAVAQVYADTLPQGRDRAVQAARDAKPRAEAAARQVAADVPAAVPDAAVLFTSATALSGVAVRADRADADALAAVPGVRAVHALTPKTVGNTGTAEVVGAVEAWRDLGNTGEGVRLGVIDTGIDYTHVDFGGSGDVQQYRALQAAEDQPAPQGVFPSVKVAGGYDFVGDAYDATSPDPAVATPRPDPNPLDCNGHGTHVAGTAAGYGVTADGKTFDGGYDAVPPDLRIGPGMAPEATLFALKVFGCEGSTLAVIPALNWALDPNGDGDPSDHLDVVNLSLGAPFGLPDDADARAVEAVTAAGVVTVLSAGNQGDIYDVHGSPGNAPRALSVAASDDGVDVYDGWRVTSPPGVLGGIRPGLRSQEFDDFDESGAVKPDVTAPVALPVAGDDPTACAPLSGDYTGHILLIQAAEFACGSATKGTNALQAGAVGFMIVDDDDVLDVGILGIPEIPGILVRASDGQAVADAVAAGTEVTVRFGPSLRGAVVEEDPSRIDTLAPFSSRGTRYENGVKPDLAAPGVNTFSADVGTGSEGVSSSGTSMAAPTASGIAALVRKAHPEWSPEEVKADLMNTAAHDVTTGPGGTGLVYGPNRVGAGRIDAVAALENSVLAYAEAGTGVVSASYGVVEVAEDRVSDTRTVTVANKGAAAATYSVGYRPAAEQPGVSYTVEPAVVTVPAGGTAAVTVTMTAVRDQLRRVPDPTVDTSGGRQFLGEASGRLVLTPTDSSRPELRVPVHSNAKPSSTLTASLGVGDRTIRLSGRGVVNGTPGRPQSYTSLVSVFEQLGTSPEMPLCRRPTSTALHCLKSELERQMDIARVGVTSDVAVAPDDPALYVAVSAHGRWNTPSGVSSFGVFIDATRDGRWDYQITTVIIPELDLPLVVVLDRDFSPLPSPDAPFVGVLNLADGSLDTNLRDSDVQVLAAPLSVMPLIGSAGRGGGGPEGSPSRIAFGVQGASGYGTADDLGTVTGPDIFSVELAEDTMSFDPLNPGLTFRAADGAPALLLPATNGTTIDVSQNILAYVADDALGDDGRPNAARVKGAMVALHHNDTATGRTQSLPIRPGAFRP